PSGLVHRAPGITSRHGRVASATAVFTSSGTSTATNRRTALASCRDARSRATGASVPGRSHRHGGRPRLREAEEVPPDHVQRLLFGPRPDHPAVAPQAEPPDPFGLRAPARR